MAHKRPRAVMVLECLKVAGVLGMVATLGRLGPLWACVAVGITFAAHALAAMWVIRRDDEIPMRSMLIPLAAPFGASAIMAGAVFGVRQLAGYLVPTLHPVVALLGEMVVGGVVYVPAALLLAPVASRDMLGLLRRALRRGKPA